MTFAGKQFHPVAKNSPSEMLLKFQNFFGYEWVSLMPDELNKFSKLLGNENKEEVGAGLDAFEKFVSEMEDKLKDNSIPIEERKMWKSKYLFSTELNPPIPNQVHQDMNAPLSHYFIHTSLNSYFTGNLVFRKYSDEPIKAALQQGVRVIELDLSPCGKDGICVRPRRDIMRKPLELQKCLDSIKEYAFTPTRSYPLIITFKDDLKPDLQSKATQMITKTFENMVYSHDDSSEVLPSPADLGSKILISRRPPKEFLYANEDVEKVDVRNKPETRHESTDQYYQSLVAFHAVEPRGKLQEALTDGAKKNQRPEWYETGVISFTQTRFLRTRLKRKHLISAPFKPQRAWMHGAQLIAQSRQEAKKQLWLMQGMFRANGGCGFVKKPDFLLNVSPSGTFYPTGGQVRGKTLKVKVYMGDGWSEDFKHRFSTPNLYVKISIAGLPHDEKIEQTAVKKNEWKPEWGEEFEFKLTYPDLALLSIQVYDKDLTADGFGGQTCLRVSELIKGIRAVPLYDENGMQCKYTMLLMRFRLFESEP